jgi:hypothetical protein
LFLADGIDFFSYIGLSCPICGDLQCYRQILPYWRYAIELFPGFKKKRVPIARFLCRSQHTTFSLLPIQLIPYFQYTVSAVIGTLLMGFGCWQLGQRGFWGASEAVDPESLVSPWLVACWLAMVVRSFRRAHRVLKRFYDLSGIASAPRAGGWKEVAGYFSALSWQPKVEIRLLLPLLCRYSRQTTQFLFGTASQQRGRIRS